MPQNSPTAIDACDEAIQFSGVLRMTSTEPRLMGKLLIDTGMGGFLGDKRIRLLEAIDKLGSISRAAKAVPFSYKGAWEAVDQMNTLTPEPIVLRSAGGRHGGGTELTAFGRRLVAYYRALEQEYHGALVSLPAVSMRTVMSTCQDTAKH